MTDEDRIAIAPMGRLRAAINLGNSALAKEDDGELTGVSPALARRLAAELDMPVHFVTYPGARRVFEDAGNEKWDIAFLAIDKRRAERVAFTRPYVIIESTYAVRADSPYFKIEEADQAGRGLIVAKGSAYDLHLSEVIRQARLIRADSPGASMKRFRDGEADMVAGVRQTLEAEFASDPDYRILPGRFKSIEQAMVLPTPQSAAQAALDEFVGRAIADGFVRQALAESGQGHLEVAPGP